MCGISGIFSYTNSSVSYQSHIHRMSCAIAHRGPDSEGNYYNKEDGIYFGHRRLAIIDLSSQAAQPMWDFEKKLALIFNGEIYNFKELRKELHSYPFVTESDSEVILAAYREWGVDCVRKFNGIFALAIWDNQQKSLFIARDHIGIKPLYYYSNDIVFAFSSEIRSLLASGLIKKELNQEALYDYLTYQSTVRSLTLVKDVYRLEAGSYMVIKSSGIKTTKYWDILSKHDFDYPDEKTVKSNVREKILTAVRRQMVSDVPIGAFLSGGIDSSILVASMALQSDLPVNTFTVTFSEKEYDESVQALEIAKLYNTNHRELHISADNILEDIPGIVEQFDNPSGDGVNSYIVSKAIRDAGLKVAVSGLGGDELFAGYGYSKSYQKIAVQDGMWSNTFLLRQGIARILTISGSSRIKKIASLIGSRDSSIQYLYPVIRALYSRKELDDLLAHGLTYYNTLSTPSLLADDRINQFPFLSQFSIADIVGYTEAVLLKDSDQMSMANSVELRVPFFDVELLEYVLGVPDKFKNPLRPKKLLVESMANLIPDSISNKKKMGFTLPWEYWMKKELRFFCEQALRNISKRGIFNPVALMEYWKRFLKGNGSVNWAQIWTIVVLEHWISNVLEGNSGE